MDRDRYPLLFLLIRRMFLEEKNEKVWVFPDTYGKVIIPEEMSLMIMRKWFTYSSLKPIPPIP